MRRNISLVLWVLVLLGIVHQVVHVRAEEILNEGFENGTVAPWVQTGDVEVSERTAHRGVSSLHMSGEYQAKISRDLAISTAGRNVTVDAWIFVEKRSKDANLAIRVIGLDEKGRHL